MSLKKYRVLKNRKNPKKYIKKKIKKYIKQQLDEKFQSTK